MDIVTRSKSLMLTVGASPVMYLMIGLSVASLGVAIERVWYYRSVSDDLDTLAGDLESALQHGDLEGAKARMRSSSSVEAKVVLAGLHQAPRGPRAAAEAITGAIALQRIALERRLAFLGTIGNNAPFIGLLGTVVGIIQAFESLGTGGGAAVMGSIAEALVATAIGLLVAIPAVAAFNWFQRRIKTMTARADALSRVLLAHLEGGDATRASQPRLSVVNGSKR